MIFDEMQIDPWRNARSSPHFKMKKGGSPKSDDFLMKRIAGMASSQEGDLDVRRRDEISAAFNLAILRIQQDGIKQHPDLQPLLTALQGIAPPTPSR